jgi:ribose 5-phosphate isomerase B
LIRDYGVDFVVPPERWWKVDRGLAICGSGGGAAVCANKVEGVRACLIHDHFLAKQGVEDDHMNVLSQPGSLIRSCEGDAG